MWSLTRWCRNIRSPHSSGVCWTLRSVRAEPQETARRSPQHKCPWTEMLTYRTRSNGGACDLAQMGCTAALYNTDYYVVSPLTLMGCYSDLKWFNGSQVGPLMAFFILQCVLWMWMTVLWSASVFLLHLLKQCDRCCFSVQEKWGISGGRACNDTSDPSLSFDLFLLSIVSNTSRDCG